ncbi:MAG TPA: aldo/keto reductase [Actinomycetota bacterium]|nr:aldo/keto reductase [Actinomycetota bacterium]
MVPRVTLNDGNSLPAIGFGTYPLRGDEAVAAIGSALEIGYRLIDTAVNYGNEADVGRAVRQSGLARDDIQITSKLPGRHHAYDDAIRSVEESLERLQVDYLDLHLIHWPNPSVGKYLQAWQALIDLRERGLIRSIGVSNFTQAHLGRIIDETGVVPAVNQIELHPRFPQEHMRAVDTDLGIITQAWSPMGKARAPLDEPAVLDAAQRLGVAPGQVILRWHIQIGSLPIPKSADPQRQRENFDVFDFALTDSEVSAISALAETDGRLFGGDPDVHEEM